MGTKTRAIVVDEMTGRGNEPYFIYMEREHQGRSGGTLRFNRKAAAEKIAYVINRELEEEGRLLGVS